MQELLATEVAADLLDRIDANHGGAMIPLATLVTVAADPSLTIPSECEFPTRTLRQSHV
jgi:hypothetical protein